MALERTHPSLWLSSHPSIHHVRDLHYYEESGLERPRALS